MEEKNLAKAYQEAIESLEYIANADITEEQRVDHRGRVYKFLSVDPNETVGIAFEVLARLQEK